MAEYSQTVNEIVDTALARIRSKTGSTAQLYDTTLNFFNLVLQELSMEFQWRFLRKETTVNTVDGTKKYNLPVDCLRVISVNVDVNDGTRSIDLMSEDEAKIAYPDDDKEGSPEAYISGVYDISDTSVPPVKSIEIKPTPDAVYVLEISYQNSFKNYASGDATEVPPIPTFLYPAVIEMIYSRLLEFTKNPRTEIQATRTNALIFLEKAKAFDRDLNKAPRSIRLPWHVSAYRQNRYSF